MKGFTGSLALWGQRRKARNNWAIDSWLVGDVFMFARCSLAIAAASMLTVESDFSRITLERQAASASCPASNSGNPFS